MQKKERVEERGREVERDDEKARERKTEWKKWTEIERERKEEGQLTKKCVRYFFRL